jgi:acyl transferase domain-containing protein
VSSSGFGGANAHAVLEDAFHYLQERGLDGSSHYTASYHTSAGRSNISIDSGINSPDENSLDPRPQLFCWSAADPESLLRMLDSFQVHLDKVISQKEPERNYHESLAYTLGERRSLLPWTTYAVSDSLHSLAKALKSIPPPKKMQSHPKYGFIFTGQGAQWLGMGKDLLSYGVFRYSVEQADVYLQSLGCSWSILG